MVRIKFSSEPDEVKGFYLLATKARVRGLPGGVYEVAKAELALLDQQSVQYVVIPPSEKAADEAQAVRNSLTVEL
jgi:hypothetical protein